MRYLSKCGLFTIDRVDNSATVSLSKKGLSNYGMFYVYIPRVEHGAVLKENQIVINIETSCVLGSIKTPFAGVVTHVNRDLIDVPFDVNEGVSLFTVDRVDPDSFNSLTKI